MADDTAAAEDSPDAEMLAELADAEADEAEALAAAARARANALRLKRAAAETSGETVETEPEPDTDAGEPAAQRSWTSIVLAGAAALIICGLLGVSGYFVWHHHAALQRRDQAAAFAAAARQELINLTSYNYTHAKEDVQRVIDNSTGEFRDDFTQRADDFASVVQQSKVISEGTVNAVAVESMDHDSAVVLVAATSNVTNAAGAKEDPRAFRMRLTVNREGDQYKVSKLEMVP